MQLPLSCLESKKDGVIKRLYGGMGFQRKISSMGIRIGKIVRVISHQPFHGPIMIQVDSMRIAIGRGMANKIIVETK